MTITFLIKKKESTIIIQRYSNRKEYYFYFILRVGTPKSLLLYKHPYIKILFLHKI